MTRRRVLVVALVCVAAFTTVGVAVIWQLGRVQEAAAPPVSGRQVDHRRLEREIERAASTRPTEVVDIADFVTGEWDRLMVFGEYTTGDVVSEVIGRDWGEGHETEEIAHEHEKALVFLRRGEVVAWVGHFDAAALECVQSARGTMRFYVREWTYPEGGAYRLLIPARPGGMRSRAARRCITRHSEFVE